MKSIPKQISNILKNSPEEAVALFYNGKGKCMFYKKADNFEADPMGNEINIYGLLGIGNKFIAIKRNNKWIF